MEGQRPETMFSGGKEAEGCRVQNRENESGYAFPGTGGKKKRKLTMAECAESVRPVKRRRYKKRPGSETIGRRGRETSNCRPAGQVGTEKKKEGRHSTGGNKSNASGPKWKTGKRRPVTDKVLAGKKREKMRSRQSPPAGQLGTERGKSGKRSRRPKKGRKEGGKPLTKLLEDRYPPRGKPYKFAPAVQSGGRKGYGQEGAGRTEGKGKGKGKFWCKAQVTPADTCRKKDE